MITRHSLRYVAIGAGLSLGLGAAMAQVSSNVVRVDANTPAAANLQDGASWATAYRHLQDALGSVAAGEEIWVADGVYYPDVDADGDSGSRNRSFAMVEGVPMFGGFAGGESLRDDRNPFLNHCILSGDIYQDDLQQPIANHTEPQSGDENNSYRVLDMAAYLAEETVDGFVITAGRADSNQVSDGAGVYCERNGRIKNCWITGNYAAGSGGGLYISGTRSFIANCRVNGNVAGMEGGGMVAREARARFFNCEFRGNRALKGGGVYLVSGNLDLKLINCAVSGNSAQLGGGGFYQGGGKLVVANCTVTGNHAGGSGGAVNVQGAKGKPTFRNVVIWNNHGEGSTAGPNASIYYEDSKDAPKLANSIVANTGGSAAWNGPAGSDQGGNLDADPLFFTAVAPSPQPSDEGVFYLRAGSPGIDAGLQAFLLADSADLDADVDTAEYVPHDLEGNPRVAGTEVDMGAYEFNAALVLDSDGDGLSDQFELTHSGDPLALAAMYDGDSDRIAALGEFLHGRDPMRGGKPFTELGTVEILGVRYLTVRFNVDPVGNQFVGYTVERTEGEHQSMPWRSGETMEVSAVPSQEDPGLVEVTHRSLYPLGEPRHEFLRLRHWVRNPGGVVFPTYDPDNDGLIPGVNNWNW